jgi:hypothetical protein
MRFQRLLRALEPATSKVGNRPTQVGDEVATRPDDTAVPLEVGRGSDRM